jgi:pyruvate formate lyase activating enzyme
MEKGIIFNIQKFSIHDGPGIRTTVFFKGCPLRCQWCANPESQVLSKQVLTHEEDCIHCLTCLTTCPKHAISHASGSIVINHQLCDHCGECIKACPKHALTMEGEEKSVSEIVDLCMQDIAFYEESNGGVTFSGGEAMMQYDFMMSLLTALKEKRVHVAIETTGLIDHERFIKAAPLFDLLLFDVKQVDEKKHLKGTGVSNDIIKKNFCYAIAQGLNVLPRIPVIPHFNDTLEDAKELADFLIEAHAKRVQLLPFHQLGEKKYKLLGKPYALAHEKPYHQEDLEAYKQIFLAHGLDCFF